MNKTGGKPGRVHRHGVPEFAPRTSEEGLRLLMLSLIGLAIEDSPRQAADVLAWERAPAEEHLFTAANCCDVLNIPMRWISETVETRLLTSGLTEQDIADLRARAHGD